MYMYITVYTCSGDGTWVELILLAYFFFFAESHHSIIFVADPFLVRIVHVHVLHVCTICTCTCTSETDRN